jgi:hypothetical protein
MELTNEMRVPADGRLDKLKDCDGYFPFEPPRTREEWERRSEAVRRGILVALGLWPMPAKKPLSPVIHGRRDCGDYTFEKVIFESFLGFTVTGSLYRPTNQAGLAPGVLCPHGHWPSGRFHDAGVEKAAEAITQGAEQIEAGARSPLQARCVQLARMGCVVFHYDMAGYADSTQIPFEVAHTFAKQRPGMNAPTDWGFFSPAAESHLQSIMGLQTFNSIRALDFLTSLPGVDAQRIAVTGASGGGTQTFILGAIDPRVSVAIPAVMVSTAMQGGCVCENASLLRIGCGNVDFAALFAPKPLCLIAANDWTREMAEKGFPQLQALYALLGAGAQVVLHPLLQFGHNYNAVSRACMYAWVNSQFKLGLPEPIEEGDYPRLSAGELTVWDDAHPRPPGGEDFERRLLRGWHEDTQRQLADLIPGNVAEWRRFKTIVGGAVDAIVGAGVPAPDQIVFEEAGRGAGDGHTVIAGWVRNASQRSELPVRLLVPDAAGSRLCVWLSPVGTAGLWADDRKPRPEITSLLRAGVTVLGVDLLGQGAFLAGGTPPEQTRLVDNPREVAAFTFGYNHSLFAQRVHDVLTAVGFARTRCTGATVALVGLAGAGPWAAAALAQAGAAVCHAAIDSGGFRFGDVADIRSPDFLPGGAKYFDLPGMLALGAPTPLWIAGERAGALTVAAAAYRAAGKPQALAITDWDLAERPAAAVRWLLS